MTPEQKFAPTRTAALAALKDFLPRAGRDYAVRRNFDLGPDQHLGVSTLSPWIRTRMITEQEVLQSVLADHSAQTAEKFIQEIYWRTYWKGWLELRPSVWDDYQRDVRHAWSAVQTQNGLRDRWENACMGRTDIACFDAWAHELVSTGYLHNHARMWFASIWIFTLELPWELGADFFLRHLLDGDPASNTLSWRWVAGIQTQGKTYLARTGNIAKFTEGRFHPKWQLASEAIPIQAPAPPPPGTVPITNAPEPDMRTGFLLHEEDLSPEFAISLQNIESSCVLNAQSGQTPLHMSENVLTFRNACLEDCALRWADKLGGVPTKADGMQHVLDWAESNRIEQIVTPYAPAGPVAKVLEKVDAHVDSPHVVQVMRTYDKTAWPHATKGFFPFKKQIPALLKLLV